MATTYHSIASSIEEFIRTECQVANNDPGFTRDVHLYDMGFVDSIGLIKLISYLETVFRVELPEEYLFSDAFTTINGISTMVQMLLKLNQSNGVGKL
jgi:acyl carrier protein